MNRSIECPGPCNPRNKSCRRACMKNVMELLEELPPCIRMRLCKEDLLAVFGRDASNERERDSQDEWTTSEDLPKEPGREETTSEESMAENRIEPEEESSRTWEEKKTQTESTGQESSISSTMARISTHTKLILAFGSRMLRTSDCSCRLINVALYSFIFLLLTAFARHTSGYQIFLSSQICGLIAILSWRISGTVPF